MLEYKTTTDDSKKVTHDYWRVSKESETTTDESRTNMIPKKVRKIFNKKFNNSVKDFSKVAALLLDQIVTLYCANVVHSFSSPPSYANIFKNITVFTEK